MSSYIVSDTTINYFLNWMWANAQATDNRWKYKELGTLGYDISRINELPELGQALFAMNIRAVNARYPGGKAEDFRPLDYQFRSMAATDVYQAIKAVKCFLYQCSEGDIDKSPLYQAMERISLEIMEAVFTKSPKYDAAQWDIEDAAAPTGQWLGTF